MQPHFRLLLAFCFLARSLQIGSMTSRSLVRSVPCFLSMDSAPNHLIHSSFNTSYTDAIFIHFMNILLGNGILNCELPFDNGLMWEKQVMLLHFEATLPL